MRTYEYVLTDLATNKDAVHEHRREGWRLVRISVPRIDAEKDWRLIFERDSRSPVRPSTSVTARGLHRLCDPNRATKGV